MSDGHADEHGLHAVEMLPDITYVSRPDGPLSGDLFRPVGLRAGPICVAVHGGGWRLGERQYFRYLAPYLAARGVAVFAISYRFASAAGNRYPACVHDVRAAVQFLRQNAEQYDIDPDRIGLMGSSAGGHLTALVALAGDLAPFAGATDDAFPGLSCRVKAAVPIYGTYDMLAQWRFDLIRPYDRLVENFIGIPPMEDKRIYHEASPLTYTTIHARNTSFLLVWGTADDRVDYTTQSLPFLEALKQSGYYVRTVIVGDAPHYWAGEPLDEPGSASGFMAPRLARFLHERL